MGTIFLVGPTAVGKSAVAVELAERLGAEIVSADSMQVYRGLDIGTAKPTAAERARVRHHLIDVCEINEVFDVRRYVELAQAVLARLQVAVVVGGTGMYIRALRHGLFDGPGRQPQLRSRLEAMSTAELFAELQRVDPQTASRIDRHNPRRLVRALEVFYATGKPIAELQTQWAKRCTGDAPPIFGLQRDRADLVARIERRIDQQMAAGWLEETRALMERCPLPSGAGLGTHVGTVWQAAGYRELAAHLRGEISLAEAVARIKLRTRQLARRQMTWFRREPGIRWLAVEADELPGETARRILSELE
ncbi:MAG: tRNA (adenosine(37)-N6)-dimethylallyltransferase MiaA [Verrucomicrobiae bacterium]|nr:tRNA (adenosine(37)-N6)-dimethylallyltransferase MiaA [Verrucomicrobiae bacterium]